MSYDSVIDQARDDGRLIRTWEHEGIECAMAIGPMMGVNGYVKVPDGVELPEDEYHIIDLEVHGGITYGPDPKGWVGFDTGHAGDAWLDPEVPQSRYSMILEKHGMEPDTFDSWTKVWTLEKLEAEVNHLASQVMALKK